MHAALLAGLLLAPAAPAQVNIQIPLPTVQVQTQAPVHHGTQTVSCSPNAAAAAQNAAAELHALEDAIDDVDSKRTRRRLRDRVRSLKQHVALLMQTACTAGGGTAVVVDPAPAPVDVQPLPPLAMEMDGPHFSELLRAVKKESFSKAKLSLLRSAMTGQCVSTDQAKQLIKQFSYASGKKDAASILVPRVLDRNMLFKLASAMEYSSGKKHVNELIQSGNVATECATH